MSMYTVEAADGTIVDGQAPTLASAVGTARQYAVARKVETRICEHVPNGNGYRRRIVWRSWINATARTRDGRMRYPVARVRFPR